MANNWIEKKTEETKTIPKILVSAIRCMRMPGNCEYWEKKQSKKKAIILGHDEF